METLLQLKFRQKSLVTQQACVSRRLVLRMEPNRTRTLLPKLRPQQRKVELGAAAERSPLRLTRGRVRKYNPIQLRANRRSFVPNAANRRQPPPKLVSLLATGDSLAEFHHSPPQTLKARRENDRQQHEPAKTYKLRTFCGQTVTTKTSRRTEVLIRDRMAGLESQ